MCQSRGIGIEQTAEQIEHALGTHAVSHETTPTPVTETELTPDPTLEPTHAELHPLTLGEKHLITVVYDTWQEFTYSGNEYTKYVGTKTQYYSFTFSGHKTKLLQLKNFHNALPNVSAKERAAKKTAFALINAYLLKINKDYHHETFSI